MVAAGSIADTALAGQTVAKSVRTGSVVVNGVRGTNGLRNKIRKFSKRKQFATHLIYIYNCENDQSLNEKSHEKMWDIIKDFMTEEIFHIKCSIPGIPKKHFFQEVFKIFKGKEEYAFISINLDTTNTSAQDAAQISFDVDRIRSNPSDNMLGLACNGMQSEQQYCEMAA